MMLMEDDELMDLIESKDYDGLKRAFISLEFDINKEYNGKSLLHYAAESDDTELVEIIASHPKVNLNARTANNLWTPLMVAASLGNFSALKRLLEFGADVACVSDTGTSALMLASKANSLECVDALMNGVSSVMINNLQDEDGLNALMYGVSNVTIVEELIQYSDLLQVDKSGRTILHMASQVNLDSVKLIVKKNVCDVNATDEYDQTPLYCAAIKKRFDIATYLIENGASPADEHVYYLAIELDESEEFLMKYLLKDPITSIF